MFGGRPVHGSGALVIGAQRQLEAPSVRHVEALGVPDVRLEPGVPALALAPRVLLQQVGRPASMLPRRSLALCSWVARTLQNKHEGQVCLCPLTVEIVFQRRTETLFVQSPFVLPHLSLQK